MNLRVDPKGVWVDRVTDANVTTRTLGKALSGKDPKGTGHMLELPLSLLVGICDLGDSGNS